MPRDEIIYTSYGNIFSIFPKLYTKRYSDENNKEYESDSDDLNETDNLDE